MAIREKLRKTFGKNKGSSSAESSKSSSTDQYYTGRTDIEYYKPHEIPKSKYRGRVDKEHQEKLDAYSFGDAFGAMRRRSSQALSGIMSPGGTKAQSRRPSYISHASKSARCSISSQGGNPLDKEYGAVGTTAPAMQPPSATIPQVEEGSDEDSSPQTVSKGGSSLSLDDQQTPKEDVPTVRLDRTATVTDDKSSSPRFDNPFSAAELEKAMTEATIGGNPNTSIHRSSVAVH